MFVRQTNTARILWILLLVIFVSTAFPADPASAQTDEEIRSLIEKAGGKDDHPDASRVVVFEKTDVDVEESGLAHVRRHILRKILSDDGVLGEAVQRFDYDPASNFIRIESIRIFRKDGSIDDVDLSSVRDLFAPAYMIYWGGRMKLAGLPRLEIGDAVEIKTYKKGFEIAYLDGDGPRAPNAGERQQSTNIGADRAVSRADDTSPEEAGDTDESRYIPPMRGHYYDVVVFPGDHPIKEKRYDLHMPADKRVRFEVYNGTLYSAQQFDEEKTHYSWWLFDIPAITREPRMADVSDVATKLVLATVPSWEEKSRWVNAVHDTIFLDNKAIKRKVREITAGLGSDLEKATALQHWAAQEIRYSGISMGEGEGYTIHPGKMIFDDRCGVCKDKAGMLITFMRTAGYEVYPALTMAGSRVEKVPADQFNHCVVAWRHEDGSYTMLDPTWVPYSTELFSSAEQEQNYVIGAPWGEDLMITPYSPPEDHVLNIVSRAELDRDGTLHGTMTISASNYMDQRMRRYLGTHRLDDLGAFIEGWLSSVSEAVELEKYTVGDPLDFDTQYELEIKYSIPHYAEVADGCIDFTSPAWSLAVGNSYLFRASTAVGGKERTLPLFIWYTQTLECDETIKLPRGLKLAGDSKTIDEAGDYASFYAERSCKNGVLESKGNVLIKHRTIPAGEYPDFRDVLNKVADYARERIIATDGKDVLAAR